MTWSTVSSVHPAIRCVDCSATPTGSTPLISISPHIPTREGRPGDHSATPDPHYVTHRTARSSVPPHWSPTSRSTPCNWLTRPPPFDSVLSGNRFSPRSTTDLSRYRPIRIFVFKFNALKACNRGSLKKRRYNWVAVSFIWNFNLFEWQHFRTSIDLKHVFYGLIFKYSIRLNKSLSKGFLVCFNEIVAQ